MIALDTRLQSLKTGQPQQDALVELFTALAAKAHEVSRIISAGGKLGNTIGDQNADGDVQKELDVMADEEFLAAAQTYGEQASTQASKRTHAAYPAHIHIGRKQTPHGIHIAQTHTIYTIRI